VATDQAIKQKTRKTLGNYGYIFHLANK